MRQRSGANTATKLNDTVRSNARRKLLFRYVLATKFMSGEEFSLSDVGSPGCGIPGDWLKISEAFNLTVSSLISRSSPESSVR
jgi:hypothetical protein